MSTVELRLLRSRQQDRTTLQALLAPPLRGLIVLGHGGRVRRKHDPGLLRGGIDVNIRRKAVWFIECADPHEADRIAGACIVTPNRDTAFRATRDLLTLAAVGGRINDFHFTVEQLDTVGFD
jgi:hypothetical protein